MADQRICSISGCGKPRYVRGWCSAHYQRWRVHGDPLAGRAMNGESERYFKEIVLAYEGDDCLAWPFTTNIGGYAQLWYEGRVRLVSRLVCEDTHGPAPTPKHEAAHSCGNGHLACVTKRHLSWKTSAGNKADMLLHGSRIKGERSHLAKLTEPEVKQIMALRGTKSQAQIAELFSVHQATVSRIHTGCTWDG